jgi:hypothetical protein
VTQYDQTNVQRVRFAVESSFGADMTSNIAANFIDLSVCKHVEIMTDTVVGRDQTIVQGAYQQNDVVISEIDPWHAEVQCYLRATGTAATAAAPIVKTSQSKFLEVILGGYQGNAGSLVVASPSPTTTTFSVTGGQGARFSEGQLIVIMLAGGTVGYLRLVTTVATDALTIWPALPSAPSTADIVLNGQILYPTDSPSGSLNLLVEKAVDRNDIYNGLGGQGTFALDMGRGNLVSWTCALMGKRYLHDDEFTTPLTSGSTITRGTYDGSQPIHSMNGLVHFGTAAGTTLTSILDAGLTVNFGIANVEVPQMSGIDGFAQWQRNTRGDITVEITVPGAHETYADGFQAGTKYGLLVQFGSSSTSIRGFAMPTLQIMKRPEPVEAGAPLRGTKLTCLVQENGHSSAKTTALQRAPYTLFT